MTTFSSCASIGEGLKISHIIKYRDQSMMVVVEGRKTSCWNCKKIGHFSRTCPQKITTTTTMTTTTTTTTALETSPATTIRTTATDTTTTPTIKNIQAHRNKKDEEGWTQVKEEKIKKSSPTKRISSTAEVTTIAPNTTITPNTTIAAAETIQTPSKKKKKNQQKQPEEMETSTSLKRRKDSGDSDKEGEKKNSAKKFHPLRNLKNNHSRKNMKKPQQPMPLQPQRPAQNIQPQPQRPAQLMQLHLTHPKHSPAQHMQNELSLSPTLLSLSLFARHSQVVFSISLSKPNWIITIIITNAPKNTIGIK